MRRKEAREVKPEYHPQCMFFLYFRQDTKTQQLIPFLDSFRPRSSLVPSFLYIWLLLPPSDNSVSHFLPLGKLTRVISGHLGWVRAMAVEPGNQWFATGAGDRVIKIWDLASGELKVSLTGHISTVRGLAISPRHPYLFSAGEDKVCRSLLSTAKVRILIGRRGILSWRGRGKGRKRSSGRDGWG
jgi:WD40 repeat protein